MNLVEYYTSKLGIRLLRLTKDIPDIERDGGIGSKNMAIIEDSKAVLYDKKYNLMLKKVTKKEILEYVSFFCSSLNAIYKRNGNSFYFSTTKSTRKYVTVAFYYDIENLPEIDLKALKLRQGIGFEDFNGADVLIVRKENRKIDWLRSIALSDADKIYSDLKDAGY